MEKNFFGKLNKILRPKPHMAGEEIAFMDFSRKEEMSEFLPELQPATLDTFSGLNSKTQEEIFDNFRKKRDAGVNRIEILSYVMSAISANLAFKNAIMDNDNSDKNYKPKNLLEKEDATKFAEKSAAKFVEQAEKHKEWEN